MAAYGVYADVPAGDRKEAGQEEPDSPQPTQGEFPRREESDHHQVNLSLSLSLSLIHE